MKSTLGKKLRQVFGASLQKTLPQFAMDKTAVVPAGWVVYRWQKDAKNTYYLTLCIHSTKDHFTVQGAWSATGVYPAYGLMEPVDIPASKIKKDYPSKGYFSFRIGCLWLLKDFWWELLPAERDPYIMVFGRGEESDRKHLEMGLNNIEPMVGDAVEKIVQYVMPYFEKELVAPGCLAQTSLPNPSSKLTS